MFNIYGNKHLPTLNCLLTDLTPSVLPKLHKH